MCCLPVDAHARQLMGSVRIAVGGGTKLVPEDSTKAQYEVLGNEAQRTSVPAGTIETLGFRSGMRLSDYQHLVDRPIRDG
jgi:hypothetical protein